MNRGFPQGFSTIFITNLLIKNNHPYFLVSFYGVACEGYDLIYALFIDKTVTVGT